MRIYRIDHRGEGTWASEGQGGELQLLTAPPWDGGTATAARTPLSDAALLAPVVPTKIVCVGRNYAAHARELGNTPPAEPLLFLKPPSALLAAQGSIELPAQSQRVEHEAEIGLVMGKRLRDATEAEALAAIFGITAVNDVTARDLQRKDVQFTRAKGFDTFCPVGPCIQSHFDLAQLRVGCRVNGQLRQQGSADQMLFGFGVLLSFISRVMTLERGDLISTGTPEGVGPLAPGDEVEVEVSGVGVLRNRVRLRGDGQR